MEQLKLIKHTEIDKNRWDKAISQAPNSRVYALSWYLDALNNGWHGLIYGDYEFCMPIFQSQKYGLKYIYQPTYSQQHGVFPNPEPKVFSLFLEKLVRLAPYIVIAYNSHNKLSTTKFKLQTKPNYILPLNATYDQIRSNYSRSHKRYINQAYKNVTISEITIEQYIELKKSNSESFIDNKTIATLQKIAATASSKGLCKLIGAHLDGNQLTAAGVFLNNGNRILYLNGVSNSEGKKLRSMYAIIDNIISKYAGQELTLDFEGSTIDGVATFFSRFGAEPEYYTIAKRNTIPILKYFMK